MNRKIKRTPPRRPRPRSKAPRGAGRSNVNVKAMILLGSALAVTTALLALGQAKTEAPRGPDNCRPGVALPAAQVVLIDATEHYRPDEAGKLADTLRHEAAALDVDGKFSIDVLQPDGRGKTLRPLFSLCKPRDGSRASAWTENRRLIEKHYSEAFAAPLDTVLGSLTGLGDAGSSPILEALYALAMALEDAGSPRRLLIISDLLEYSQLMNMYRAYSWERARRLPKVRAMQDRLSGVEVTILLRLHERAPALQGEKHERFWRSYFAYAGVPNLKILPL